VSYRYQLRLQRADNSASLLSELIDNIVLNMHTMH
tara:strand:- start:1044 stop:1148 length:105 start_codon:yes stop_codon:yes gene_type:complete